MCGSHEMAEHWQAVVTTGTIFCEPLLNVQKRVRIQKDTAPTQVTHWCAITVAVADSDPRNWCYERSENLLVTNDVQCFFFFGDLPMLMFYGMLITVLVVSIYGRLWTTQGHEVLLLTNYMEEGPFWSTKHFSATQIPRILWNSKVRDRVHKSPATLFLSWARLHVMLQNRGSQPVHFPGAPRPLQENKINKN